MRNVRLVFGDGNLVGDLIYLRRAIVEMFDAIETFDQQPSVMTSTEAHGPVGTDTHLHGERAEQPSLSTLALFPRSSGPASRGVA